MDMEEIISKTGKVIKEIEERIERLNSIKKEDESRRISPSNVNLSYVRYTGWPGASITYSNNGDQCQFWNVFDTLFLGLGRPERYVARLELKILGRGKQAVRLYREKDTKLFGKLDEIIKEKAFDTEKLRKAIERGERDGRKSVDCILEKLYYLNKFLWTIQDS